jgi:hypothetical protein
MQSCGSDGDVAQAAAEKLVQQGMVRAAQALGRVLCELFFVVLQRPGDQTRLTAVSAVSDSAE